MEYKKEVQNNRGLRQNLYGTPKWPNGHCLKVVKLHALTLVDRKSTWALLNWTEIGRLWSGQTLLGSRNALNERTFSLVRVKANCEPFRFLRYVFTYYAWWGRVAKEQLFPKQLKTSIYYLQKNPLNEMQDGVGIRIVFYMIPCLRAKEVSWRFSFVQFPKVKPKCPVKTAGIFAFSIQERFLGFRHCICTQLMLMMFVMKVYYSKNFYHVPKEWFL